MKKTMYILSMVMTSSLFAMQENNSAHAIAIQTDNKLAVNRYMVNIAPISYQVESKLKDTIFNLQICTIKKTPATISAEYMEDLMKGNEGKRYTMHIADDGATIIPTVLPLMCVCSPENNENFFATREFSVKNGGTFLLTFDRDRYSVAVRQDGNTEQVDTDTVANGIARYKAREINSAH